MCQALLWKTCENIFVASSSALAAFLDNSGENIVVLKSIITCSLEEDIYVYNKGWHFYEIVSFFFLSLHLLLKVYYQSLQNINMMGKILMEYHNLPAL